MKLQIASDLHLELLEAPFPGFCPIQAAPEAEALILAGDIHSGVKAVRAFANWPVPVLLVPGNHEFYGEDFARALADMRAAARGTAVSVLDRDEVVLGSVRFLGATLWTDYRFFEALPLDRAMALAYANLADHHVILTDDGQYFSPEHALREHRLSRAWLAQSLARPFEGKTVVISHHGPHARSVNARFEGAPLNVAFVSNLELLLAGGPSLWVHGHVHDNFDYQVKGCRVVANPRGYAPNRWQARGTDELQWENRSFEPSLVVEV